MRAIGWMVVVGLGLAGCATARTPLTVAEYQEAAVLHTGIHFCGTQGHMDPATAATGLGLVQDRLRARAYDPVQWNAMVQYYMGRPERPTQEHCNVYAMRIAMRAKDQEANIAYAKQSREEQA